MTWTTEQRRADYRARIAAGRCCERGCPNGVAGLGVRCADHSDGQSQGARQRRAHPGAGDVTVTSPTGRPLPQGLQVTRRRGRKSQVEGPTGEELRAQVEEQAQGVGATIRGLRQGVQAAADRADAAASRRRQPPRP